MRHMSWLGAGAIALAAASYSYAAGADNTLFLHHLDSIVGQGPGAADYANGDPTQQIGSPNGPGGVIVSSPAKFGTGSLYRSDGASIGGRTEYQTAGNWDASKGTIEMWINSANILGGGFVGLWGTDTSSGSGDIRMYIYDTGAGRTLGAYMLGGTNGAAFWEIEQAVPSNLLTNNQWHHVAWAYDTTAGQTATWWDGHLLRNTPDAGTVNYHAVTNTLFHIGENQAGSAPFPGYIDEFRISDVVRYGMSGDFTPPTAPFAIPEPAGLALLATAGSVLAGRRRGR